MSTRQNATTTCIAVLAGMVSFGWAGELSVDTLIVNQQGNFYGPVNVVPLPTGAIPTNGLVVRYDFAANTTSIPDLSGNNHTGLVYGATWTNAGARGGGFYFDGNNDYIRVPKTSMLNITGQLTVALWINKTSTPNTMTPICKHDTGDSSPSAYWSLDITDINFRWRVATNNQINTSLVFGGWKHIVIVQKDSASWLYEDGVLVSTANEYTILNNNKDVLIGRRCDGQYFKGTIDEVLIYKRTLSADEVLGLYYVTGTFTNSLSGTVNVSNTLTVANAVIQNNPQGTNIFAGKMQLESGIQCLAPLGDISMGTYTNTP